MIKNTVNVNLKVCTVVRWWEMLESLWKVENFMYVNYDLWVMFIITPFTNVNINIYPQNHTVVVNQILSLHVLPSNQ